ncbi:inner membrane transport protein RhmT [Ditylenchus destructor]|nr:inner membrane transport protein RhmT [Ditylenchus destructor]
MYIMAFLDRANVGFAKVAFQADTGISDAAFAFGAGVFSQVCAAGSAQQPDHAPRGRPHVDVPDHGHLGPGVAAMMFATTRPRSTCCAFCWAWPRRVLPGVILYLTYWFPAAHRAQAMGFFTSARRWPSSSAARCRACCWSWTAWAAGTAGSGCSRWRG